MRDLAREQSLTLDLFRAMRETQRIAITVDIADADLAAARRELNDAMSTERVAVETLRVCLKAGCDDE